AWTLAGVRLDRLHVHPHVHGAHPPHVHFHAHSHGTEHDVHSQPPEWLRRPAVAYAVGTLHGVAWSGTAAVLAILVATPPGGAVGSRVLGVEDLGDFVLGHVSVRDPDGRGIWMKATGWGFEEITPDRVQLLGWEGQILAGEGRRHVEYPIHTEIIRARRDVNSVVHAHAPHAVAFGSLQVPLRPNPHEGGLFVPPDIARFTKTGDLILTRELGEALAHTLGGRNAAMMVHHGIVTAGETVEAA